MCDNRTAEFQLLARNLGASSSSAPMTTGRYNAEDDDASHQLRVFHKAAGEISRDIASTSALLGELTQLVKSKSLFQDDTARVNSLVLTIKRSIENLNGRLDDASLTIQRQKRNMNRQAGQQATNLVGQLQEEFVQATAGFKHVLQARTDIQKETTDRKRQVYDTQQELEHINLGNKPPVYGLGMNNNAQSPFPTLDLTSGMTAGESTSSASQLPRPHGATVNGYRRTTSEPMPTFSGGTSTYTLGGGPPSTPLTPLDIQRMEQENQQMMQLIPDQDYLRERADAMSQVETNIVELGTIFNKLAGLVNEHKELVTRVEDNVDEANTNINLSLSALADTLTNLQTNRALFFKVFGILTIFIIIFIIFFA